MALRQELPTRQRELLNYIAEFIRDGQTPDLRELVRLMGVSNFSGLDKSLLPLQKKGYITIQGGVRGRQRAVAFTDLGRGATLAASNSNLLPHVGRITAGLLREAVQECVEYIDVGNLLETREGDFLLTVDGDSMIDAHIIDGDMVQLRPNVDIHNGLIAAAQVKHQNGLYESTLKYWHFSRGRREVILRPANSSGEYAEVTVPARNVEVAGVYRALIRPVPK